MNIKQAIQSSANVIRVTNISAGDVYKRFDPSYDDRVYYGVVRSIHNDGEVAIVEALEYSKQYGDLQINLKIVRGDKDYTLFPAEPNELGVELESIVVKKEKEIATKARETAKLEAEIAELKSIISGETLRDLKSMSYKELTQAQYQQKKLDTAI
jgi:hypothetical protein